MPSEKYGEFCQWHPSTFYVSKADMSALVGHSIDRPAIPLSPSTEPNGDEDQEPDEDVIFFKCAEQFMMYCKAGRSHDIHTQARILASNDPKEQKKLGKSTKGFVDEIWDDIKSEVVVAGNMAKFGQNSRLKAILLGTGERELCEAASRDRVWGIGYTAKHAMNHLDNWGENRL